jgi:hypothetical protein
MTKFKEHEVVVLTIDMTWRGLKIGTVGTVVHTYKRSNNAQVYEVEFDNKVVRVYENWIGETTK